VTNPNDHTCEPRWRRLPKERPAQIVRAALEVFGERGLAGARLDDIARRAGLSKGTIYLYFPNKEELFREVIRTVVVGQIEQARAATRDGDPREELLRYMREFWGFVRSSDFQAIHRLVYGELANFPDLAAFYGTEVVAASREVAAEIIRRGIACGEFRQTDPDMAARTVNSMLMMHAAWCEKRHLFRQLENLSDEQIFDSLVDFSLHAIAGPGASAPTRARKLK
jgi:AcrR family transcriptional regulator